MKDQKMQDRNLDDHNFRKMQDPHAGLKMRDKEEMTQLPTIVGVDTRRRGSSSKSPSNAREQL